MSEDKVTKEAVDKAVAWVRSEEGQEAMRQAAERAKESIRRLEEARKPRLCCPCCTPYGEVA